MKKLLGIVCGLILLAVLFYPQGSQYGYSKSITIPEEIFNPLQSFIQTGKVEKDGWMIDFSDVQTITVAEGKAVYNPPAKISGKVAFVGIKTTITEIRATAKDTIIIDIDNSPVDLELTK
jgi:hypothetical protein